MNSTVAFCNSTVYMWQKKKKKVIYSQFMVDVVDGDEREETIYYFNIQ